MIRQLKNWENWESSHDPIIGPYRNGAYILGKMVEYYLYLNSIIMKPPPSSITPLIPIRDLILSAQAIYPTYQ